MRRYLPRLLVRALHTPVRTWLSGALLLALLAGVVFVLATVRPPAGVPAGGRADQLLVGLSTYDADALMAAACPELLSGVSREQVAAGMERRRLEDRAAGVSRSWELVGTRGRPAGGEVRFYLVTEHEAKGPGKQISYVLWTTRDGCTERIE